MGGTLIYLEQHERQAVTEFCRRLVQLDGVRPIRVWLFGSKTRGDFGPDSDIDILVVLEAADWKRKEQIHLTDSRISLEYNVLLNTHILSRERWEELARHQATLWREIERDGVVLLPEPDDAPAPEPTNK